MPTDGWTHILRVKRPAGTPATAWINAKVAHNANTGRIQVYLDDRLVTTVDDRGPATRHFKNGVYHHGNGRAEARFRNIHHWTR